VERTAFSVYDKSINLKLKAKSEKP